MPRAVITQPVCYIPGQCCIATLQNVPHVLKMPSCRRRQPAAHMVHTVSVFLVPEMRWVWQAVHALLIVLQLSVLVVVVVVVVMGAGDPEAAVHTKVLQ